VPQTEDSIVVTRTERACKNVKILHENSHFVNLDGHKDQSIISSYHVLHSSLTAGYISLYADKHLVVDDILVTAR